jgi:hypothetical protein
MATIADVRVWKNDKKTETRVYVHTTDNREACIYRTGNPWHAAGSIESKLTADEFAAAKKLAFYDNLWHTVYNNETKRSSHHKCPDCGGWDTCGANCTANRF